MPRPEYAVELDNLRINYDNLRDKKDFPRGISDAITRHELPAVGTNRYTPEQVMSIITAVLKDTSADALNEECLNILTIFKKSDFIKVYLANPEQFCSDLTTDYDRASAYSDLGRVDDVAAHSEPTNKSESVATYSTTGEGVIAPATAFLGATAAAGESAKYAMTSAPASTTFFQPRDTIKKLLECVAHGEQQEAEKILRRQPELLAQRGDVVDYSGRTFSNISPWEYMLWALDTRYMGRMMLNCIPNTDAGNTIRRELSTQYDAAPTHYDFKVIEAIDEYVKLYDELQQKAQRERKGKHFPSDRESRRLLDSWMKIGIEQRQMPAHVFHQYCNPNSSFLINFDFKEDELKRTDQFFNHTIGKYERLFSTHSIHADLGVKFALEQILTSCDAAGLASEPELFRVETQSDALRLLQTVRMEDAKELRRILQVSLELAPSAPPIETKGMS